MRLCALLLALGACRPAPPAPPPEPPPEAELAPLTDTEAVPPGAAAVIAAAAALPPEAPKGGDLAALKARGELRILVEAGEDEGLPRAGSARARDRALLTEFAARHGLTARFVAADGFESLFTLLAEGQGDVIANSLTVTRARSARVDFTQPVATVKEWLVGRRGQKGLPRKPEELVRSRLAVHVRATSAFADSLRALAPGPGGRGVRLVEAPQTLSPEELAYEVSRGKRPLTVVDEPLLRDLEAYNPDLVRLFPVAQGRELAWAVRKDSPELRAALNAFIIEKALLQYTEEAFTGDLDGIRKRGVLRLITRNNPVTYYIHRGEPRGFDYELAALLARALKVRLEVVVPPGRDQLLPYLLEGKGDLVAASLTVTPERAAQVAFSRPYLEAQELLVSGRGAAPLARLEELKGKRIHVRRSSSYFQTLTALQERYGPFTVVEEDEAQETEALLGRASDGDIPYTVADSHLVAVERAHNQALAEGLPLGPPRPIAFALRPGNRRLRAVVDAFLQREHRGLHYNLARRRYFESPASIAAAVAEHASASGQLSPYDALIKKYASRYHLDWRLMTAQAWQESRFQPDARSFAGAVGLFQVMPRTGRELGFEDLEDPEQSTHAGILYVSRLAQQLPPTIPLKQRLRFALAGYNAGMGHVHDARRLAAEKGLDPDRWFGNVEKAMLLLQRPEYYGRARHGYCRGSEPVAYVSRIQQRYLEYVGVVAN